MPKSAKSAMTVGAYLLKRLEQLGVKHIFGVPGDFVLGFFDQIVESNIELVNTCNELNAGYAADGYGRINGIGAISTTYDVGELSALNAMAGSYAEYVPVVSITGSPTTFDRAQSSILHHTLGDYNIPFDIYKKVSVAAEILLDPKLAPSQIDNTLRACITQKRPVYFVLPADVAQQTCEEPVGVISPTPIKSNPDVLKEAIDETVALLKSAKKPAILAGVEIQRFGLQKNLLKLLEKTGYPFATMLLGKTSLPEDHPQFIGLYEGVSSREYVKKRIEDSDALLSFGAIMSDLNLGGFTANLNDEKFIKARMGRIKVKNHYFLDVNLEEYIDGLIKKLPQGSPKDFDVRPASEGCVHRSSEKFTVQPNKKLTFERFFDWMAHFIPENSIVVAEVGSAIFGASEVLMPKNTTFIGQAFYGSIGYSVGAVLGACMAAPKKRVIAFIGDGSFQLTAQEISTVIRHKLKPIIFLINNDGYTIERLIHDGPYNDIQPWKYHKLPEVFGNGKGYDVHTEGELEEVLKKVEKNDVLSLVEIHFERLDCSSSLKRAGEQMAKKNKLKE